MQPSSLLDRVCFSLSSSLVTGYLRFVTPRRRRFKQSLGPVIQWRGVDELAAVRPLAGQDYPILGNAMGRAVILAKFELPNGDTEVVFGWNGWTDAAIRTLGKWELDDAGRVLLFMDVQEQFELLQDSYCVMRMKAGGAAIPAVGMFVLWGVEFFDGEAREGFLRVLEVLH